jgi:peptidyl-tRNA hydrolase
MHDCAKLVVVIRRDLHLGRDTLVIQACHAGLGALEDITPLELEEWERNEYQTVVLLCTGEGELMRLEALASLLGVNCYLAKDEGGIAIALGLGPSTELRRVTGSLPLWYPQADSSSHVVVH